MNPLETILSRLGEIEEEMTTLHAQDTLTEDDETRFEELSTEFDELNTTRETIVERAETVERIRVAAQDPRNTIAGNDSNTPLVPVPGARTTDPWDYDEIRTAGSGDPVKATSELRSRALSAAETTRGLSDRQREHLAGWLDMLDVDDGIAADNAKSLRHVLAVSHPEYRKAFAGTLAMFGRTGVTNGPGSEFLTRAMGLTDNVGGFAVPLPIDPTIIINDDGTESPFRAISTVKTITTDVLRTVNTTAVSVSWDGEAGEVSDDTTVFANTDITVYKAQGFIPFSIEIGMDFPNLLGTLGSLIATEKGDAEATVHATGTGSSQPIGIVTALTGGSSEIASNGSDVFALSDVYDIEEELPAKFRRRATWTANKRIYQAMREAGGTALDDFWVNLGQGQPKQLLGYNSMEADQMDGTFGSGENYVLILGDFTDFWIVDRVGLSIELVPHLFATANNRPSGQRGLYAWWRTGSDSVNDRAFRMLNVT